MSGGNSSINAVSRRSACASTATADIRSATSVTATAAVRPASSSNINGSRSGGSGETAAAAGEGGARDSGDVTGRPACVDGASTVEQTEAHHSCSQRLKLLLNKAEREDICRDELITHLEYLITVLDSAYIDEARSGFEADDDDELSKVEAEAVPSEVRDWLAQTFTRSMATSATKRSAADNKPKFRSVANAIRAGILVDRIYRRISSPSAIHIPANVASLLKNIDSWSFDVFAVNSVSDNNALKFVSYELLQRYDVIAKFKISIPVLENLLVRLQAGYSKYSNPYHNLVHAADITQTMHYVIQRSGLALWLSDVELFAAVFAAMIHDFEHTGTTNTFHVNTGSDVALLYNDKAVLENHHLSSTFRILKEDEYNILAGLKLEEYREFRSIVIDMVLATDMSFHFQQIKNMKSHLNTPDSIDKTKALSLIVHCADISHPSKAWELHHRWTELLIEEFFRQGDREEALGLPISPLCDRKNTLVAESQIGFIDFIVDPSMQVMGDMVEKIVESFQQSQTNNSLDEEGRTPSATTVSPSAPPKSPLSPADVAERRPWERCLVVNKSMWKDRAATGWISPLQEPTKHTEAASSQRHLQQDERSELQRLDGTEEVDSGVESPGPRSTSSTSTVPDSSSRSLMPLDNCTHPDDSTRCPAVTSSSSSLDDSTRLPPTRPPPPRHTVDTSKLMTNKQPPTVPASSSPTVPAVPVSVPVPTVPAPSSPTVPAVPAVVPVSVPVHTVPASSSPTVPTVPAAVPAAVPAGLRQSNV